MDETLVTISWQHNCNINAAGIAGTLAHMVCPCSEPQETQHRTCHLLVSNKKINKHDIYFELQSKNKEVLWCIFINMVIC
jgi:hypothetical protein